MDHLISVIVPVHNAEPYLGKCIDSILHQTYQNLEIVLVDGASQDQSGIICDEYVRKDPRIKVIHKEDNGVTSNRKAGLAVSRGEYISFIDSDDWIEPDMYEFLLNMAVRHQVDIVTSGQSHDSDWDSVITVDGFPEGKYDLQAKECKLWRNLIYTSAGEQGILWGLWNKLIKRESVYENYMRMDDRITRSEDIAVWLAAMLDSQSVYITHRVFYHYCQHFGSVVRTSDEIYFERMNCWFQYLREKIGHTEHFNDLAEQIDRHMVEKISEGLSVRFPFLKNSLCIRYTFDTGSLRKESRIVIYGAGTVGSDYYKQLSNDERYQVVLWVDQNSDRYDDRVSPVSTILETEYDVVLIAIKRFEGAMLIKRYLIDMGLDENKIIWLKPIDNTLLKSLQ